MQTDLVCEMKVNESTQFKSVYKGAVSYTHLTLPTKRIV